MSSRRAALGAFVGIGAWALGCSGGSESGPLTDAEAEALRFVREEEKLARDVYAALGAYGDPFENVQASEQEHMDAVLALLDAHDLPDPAEGLAPGEFADASLQALHDELVREGLAGRTAALGVGCRIEELDLRDLAAAQARAVHEDVVATYDQLLRGSRNHLRAFYGRLLDEGGTYQPRYLDLATFEAIVTSAPERGGPRR